MILHGSNQFVIWQLMNEAEYLMKNYGDEGRDLHNSSYNKKAEFNIIVLLFIQNNSY